LLHSVHREVGHIALSQTVQLGSKSECQEAYPPAPGIKGLPAGYVHCSFHHPHPWGPALQTSTADTRVWPYTGAYRVAGMLKDNTGEFLLRKV